MSRLLLTGGVAHLALFGVAGVAVISPYFLHSIFRADTPEVVEASGKISVRAPVKLNVAWTPSPNFTERPPGVVVDTVVLHATVVDSLELTVKHFARSASRVSAHYTVGKDGRVVKHVQETHRAHHAGVSRMRDGREGVNDFSIGIELVNRNDGLDAYPKEQIEALNLLLDDIRSRHEIRHIVSHAEIAQPPGRKSDPAGFDFNWIR